MDKIIKIFPTPYALALSFAEELVQMIKVSAGANKIFTIALSGGSTPATLFELLSDHFSYSVPWQYVHMFWGDERCLPPDDDESNFGMTNKKLFSRIDLPPQNIHRIKGEEDPVQEAFRYSNEIKGITRMLNGLPVFDLIILGLGEDGHTASIFPGHIDLFNSEKICEVALHPVTHQKRITITGRTLNNADNLAFLVTGRKKSPIVEKMFKNNISALNYPATYIVPVHGQLSWFLDQEAGRLL